MVIWVSLLECMACKSLKVHSLPTTNFVVQIVKDVVKGERQLVTCHQQIWFVGIFCHLNYNHVIIKDGILVVNI